MARAFVVTNLPDSPVLLHYGAGFPDFIAAFSPAAPLPYLADVARIEHAATEAYHERDAEPLAHRTLASVRPDQAPMLRFGLHPSVRLVRSPYPAFTVWRMNAPDGTLAPVDLSEAQDTMVLRPDAEVDVRQVLPASYDFVATLGQGLTLAHATEAALATDVDFDLSQNLRELIQMGAFVSFEWEAGEKNRE